MKRFLKLIISSVFWLIGWVLDSICSLFGQQRPATVSVLYYHTVYEHQKNRFERQMQFLSRLTRPVPADFAGERTPGKPYSSVTFDDALICVAEYALPAMMKYQIPVAIFVPTGHMGKEPQWTDRYPDDDRDLSVMSPEQLRRIARNPLVTLGSHTVTHPRLSYLSVNEIEHEVCESKKQLEQIAEREVSLLAFPHGDFDQTTVDVCMKNGYRRVFTVNPQQAFTSPDEFVTGRVNVDPSDWPLEFWLKINGAYHWIKWARVVKRMLRLESPQQQNASQKAWS